MAYDIYMHHKPKDDTTPLSAESPVSNVTESPRMTLRSGVTIGYAAMVGRQTMRTAVEQTRLNGNEETATLMSNASTVIEKGILAYATVGLSLIPEGISFGVDAYSTIKERRRNNIQREIENSLRGKNINMGGGTYD